MNDFFRMSTSGAVFALCALFSSCGGTKSTSPAAQLDPASENQLSGIQNLRRGDQTRTRDTYTLKNAGDSRSRHWISESIRRVSDFLPGDLFSIDRYIFPYRGAPIQDQSQISRQELVSQTFTSLADLNSFCVKKHGKSESHVTVDAGTFEACRVESDYSLNVMTASGNWALKEGRGQQWFGQVPFGLLKQQWVSNDRSVELQQVVITYQQNGESFPKALNSSSDASDSI